MGSSNTRQTRKELAQQRKSGGAEGSIIGYEDEGGVPREVGGDAEGPHLKVPPFTEDPQVWLPSTLLSGTEYTALPAVDTKQFRLLTAYFTYVIPTPGGPPPPQGVGQLSIIPEKLALDVAGELQWYTTSVVDVTVATITPTGTRFGITNGFASRFFDPAEFRWPRATATGPITLRTMLTFEVSDADSFRLNVLENNAASDGENTLSALYARSQ